MRRVALGEPVLADKSAWVQQPYSDSARDVIAFPRPAGRLHLCAVISAELLFSSRSADEMAAYQEDLSLLEVLHIEAEVEDRVTWICESSRAGEPAGRGVSLSA